MSSRKAVALSAAILIAGGLLYFLARFMSPGEPRGSSSAGTTSGDSSHPPITSLDVDTDNPQALETALQKNPNHTPILMRMAEIAREKVTLTKQPSISAR